MRRPLVPFLWLFLPAALVILGGTWLQVAAEHDQAMTRLRSEERLGVGLAQGALGRGLEGLAQDLHHLSSHGALRRLLDGGGAAERQRLGESFVRFLEAKPGYDQVRWIDEAGREVLRADRASGAPALVPPESLQDKRDRPYVAATLALEPGQLYLSPMDLNVEHGRLDEPHKPTVRLATPVADGSGRKRGLVIVNFLGEHLIRRLAAVAEPVGERLALVNGEGFWLHAPDRADEWGFVLGAPERSLARRHPAAWARMTGGAGQFEDADGLWTYQTLQPLGGERLNAEQRWIVVAHLPAGWLAATLDHEARQEWLLAGLLLVIAAAVAAYLARVRCREQLARERFRAVFDHGMVGMASLAPDGRWLAVNPALCRILGRTEDELHSLGWPDLIPNEDRAEELGRFAALAAGDSAGYARQLRLLRPDGRLVQASVALHAVRRADGTLDSVAAVVDDVSDRLAAEDARRQAATTLRRFIDHLPGMAYVMDARLRVLAASRGFQTLLGVDPEAMVGRLPQEIFPGSFGEKIAADDARVLASGRTEVILEEFGGRRYETTKFVIPRDGGAPDLGGITIDVTGRHRAEEQLNLQAARSAVLLELPGRAEALPEAEFVQYALTAAQRLTGSVTGFMHFVTDEGAGSERAPVVINDPSAAAGQPWLPEGHGPLRRLIRVPVVEDAAVRLMAGVADKPLPYGDMDVETVQLIGNAVWRIVRQRRTEGALRLATQVVNASPVVCFRWAASEGWPVLFASENVIRWGYTAEQLQAGQPAFVQIIHPDDLARVVDEMSRFTAFNLTSFEQEYRIVAADGQVIWVVDRTTIGRAADGRISHYDGVLTDITDRKLQQLELAANLAAQQQLNKRLEEAHNQLLQSEKMASIGQLAAGVAHELNNPIGFVHSNLGTLDGYLRDLIAVIDAYDEALAACGGAGSQGRRIQLVKEERDFEYVRQDVFSLVAESKEGLDRVRRIVQDLKSFSRVGEQEWKESDLHQGLDSTLTIVWNELKYKCQVVKEYGDIPPVYCLISQLNQVFMNLLVNAGQAIEKQGTITIRTRRQGDDRVCVEISDTGKGIDAAHRNRIFEPFFTTKPVGKGTGLGLSVSYGIVERHQGRIEFDSEPGRGTTFRVLLPIRPMAPPPGC